MRLHSSEVRATDQPQEGCQISLLLPHPSPLYTFQEAGADCQLIARKLGIKRPGTLFRQVA